MVKKREMPARGDLVDYNHSVAGHAGTMCDADGTLFIKPCTQQELDFYNSATADYPDFADLMPGFVGSLLLNDKADLATVEKSLPGLDPETREELAKAVQAHVAEEASDPEPAPKAPAHKDANGAWIPNKTNKIKTDLSVVLENASHGFHRPNILDAKLGKRLWADDAPQQKKTRFDKITSETTHGTLGFRIAGMRAYRGSLDKAELDHEDYRIYDKDYGRKTVNDSNVLDAFRSFVFNPAAGITKDLGRAVAAAFVRDLRNVEEVISAHESRMYSSSLLFVFEGDGEHLREAIEANNAAADELESAPPVKANGRASSRVDSGIALMDGDHPDDDVAEDDSDTDSDDPGLPPIFQLKLIDFAHAEWTPGQGPDENALMGVRSLIRIFEQLAE
ncbi:inositol polyphosphate multikinase [Plectosphaerella plurivora]|uniref:Kinase n=1 Tax=Plectosphaerella plurivora TaxID=936078 RepID=A0A9P9AAV7_9PEZI|nr:inositol polyphosphate multikinase [Plectosphaerella plurivora]